MKNKKDKLSVLPVAITFVALAAGIISVGTYVYQKQKESIKLHQHKMLAAVADEKVKQIVSWRRERLKDAEILSQNSAFALEVKKFFSGDKRAQNIVLDTISSLYRCEQYISIQLLDLGLKSRWYLGYRGDSIGPYARHLVLTSLEKREVAMSDLHEFPDERRIHIDIAAPLTLREEGREEIVGAIMMRIDPATFLFPTIQSWPMPSDSAETLMVRREGEEVVFLNELRFVQGAALKLRRKLTEKELPAAMAALGARGFVQGKDYRGKPVLACIKEVPETNWLILAKIDIEEIYRPINQLAIFIGVTVLAIIFACAFGLSLVWSRRMRTHYEREHALETNLREKEEHYRLIAENTADVVWVMDIESERFFYLSPSAYNLSGYTPAEAENLTLKDLLMPQDYPSLRRALHERIESFVGGKAEDRVRTTRHVLVGKGGKMLPVETSATIILDKEGKPKEIVGVTRDISAQWEAEEAIRRLNEELERRVAERTNELEAFSYSVSHDLRAPLRAISGFARALEEDFGHELSDEAKGMLSRILQASDRMSYLIDELLKLSRLSRQEIKKEQVDLGAMARDIMDELRSEDPSRHINFTCYDNMFAWADRKLIFIALRNLLDNAWKFTSIRKEEAKIEFGVENGENGSVYFIRDNGTGFDMRYAEKLFHPFQRLHGLSEYPGTGIGLTIVDRIIKRHGGWIRGEGMPHAGATFYFYLPHGEETGK
ncbi:MAG: PAS domain S-box protein [Syntrophales bacterium]|nr:PAS domain S-box protein [Syntrophales bacterium]